MTKKNILGLASIAANLGQQEIDTEWGVLVNQMRLQFGNLLTEHLRRVAHATNDTATTGICHSSSELGTSGNVHTRQQDGVVDAEKVSSDGLDLFYIFKSLH